LKNIDPTGIVNAVSTCKDKTKKKRDCDKAIVSSVANFDPTGVVGLVSLFMHDICTPLPKVNKNLIDKVVKEDSSDLLKPN